MKFKSSLLNKVLYWIYYRLYPGKIIFHQEGKDLSNGKPIILQAELRTKLRNLKIGLVRDTDRLPYYTKFERFLENNNLDYYYYNIYNSDWLNKAEEFDIIIWRPVSCPWQIEDAREKIFVLEKKLEKKILPSFEGVFFYENKVLQYYLLSNHGFPVIRTFISSNYEECLEFINKADYPLVHKIKTGSGSTGVKLVKSKRQAIRMVKKIFGIGLRTYWPFLKTKNYVFFQDFIPNEGYDLRVIVLDKDHIFGYYRYPSRNDFRASGFGAAVKKDIPLEAVKIALDVKETLNLNMLAVDFLKSSVDGRYNIVETSNFIEVITSIQLMVDNLPGKYSYDSINDRLVFEEGQYWLQELMLKNFFQGI